ncbi:cytochrome c oxidase subunit 5B, mitochondrial-like [Corticium candelabrum]|uniref:cytochrome c oxidase subunit 5B, mitochondrial-like n=1 Tax=Corticium candelabrum TaxID=121492 RepID=UPI002E263B9E|nr:cytochrome c oxidase subunit 5B, mitochondrial-like [Corticium candelabrum]
MASALLKRSLLFPALPFFRRAISTGLVYRAEHSEGHSKIPEAKLGVAGVVPSDTDQATGLEKLEHDALMAGIEDPFNLNMSKPPGDGSRQTPFIITSPVEERIIGCICEPDDHAINWMVLKSGPPQRCECGYFHVLQKGNPNKVEF